MISVVETEASDKKLCGGSVMVGCFLPFLHWSVCFQVLGWVDAFD